MTRSLLRAKTALALILASSFVAACGGAAPEAASPPSVYEKSAAADVAPEPMPVSPGSGGGAVAMKVATTPAPQNAKSQVTSDPKSQPEATISNAFVIYTGGVSMMEDQEKIPALIDKMIDLSESMGGRLQGRRDDGVTIRVPSQRFRETMTKIDALGAVTHRSVKAEDVSEEYHDAEVRLVNLKATRQRMQDFLGQTKNVQEALTIERELERVALEIDRVQGKLRYLSERAALSVIDITIAAKPKPTAPIATNPTNVTPQPKGIELPIDWLDNLGAPNLSNLK